MSGGGMDVPDGAGSKRRRTDAEGRGAAKLEINTSDFECSVCLEFKGTGPTWTCGNGHTIHKGCFTGLVHPKRCPTCRCGEWVGGNLDLDSVLGSFEVACPKTGCGARYPAREHTKHQEACPWQDQTCPACGRAFPHEAFMDHLKEVHSCTHQTSQRCGGRICLKEATEKGVWNSSIVMGGGKTRTIVEVVLLKSMRMTLTAWRFSIGERLTKADAWPRVVADVWVVKYRDGPFSPMLEKRRWATVFLPVNDVNGPLARDKEAQTRASSTLNVGLGEGSLLPREELLKGNWFLAVNLQLEKDEGDGA